MLSNRVMLEFMSRYMTFERIKHSQRVACAAADLAKKYSLKPKKAYIAGMLHDIARDLSKKELLYLARKNKLYCKPVDLLYPDILHAYVGAWLVNLGLGIQDMDILQSIWVHTLARPGMSDFDKVVFLADVIEPARDFDSCNSIRIAAFNNLDKAMLLTLDSSIKHLIINNRKIHVDAIKARNYFLKRLSIC